MLVVRGVGRMLLWEICSLAGRLMITTERLWYDLGLLWLGRFSWVVMHIPFYLSRLY
jgi:hypothetical protein